MQRLLRWRQIQASERAHRRRGPRAHTDFSQLGSLPLELFQMVLDQLDLVSLICLRNTTTRFRALIPRVADHELSRCQKWLIMCRFETDMLEYPERVACAFCKIKRPQTDFGVLSWDVQSKLETLLLGSQWDHMSNLNMMRSKPLERYCYRHLTSCFGWPPAFQNATQIKWVHTLEPTCLHCGSKPSSCGQSAVKFLQEIKPRSCCSKTCDVCPTAYLSTYLRHGPIRSHWLDKLIDGFCCWFDRLDDGTLVMKEWRGTVEHSVPRLLTRDFIATVYDDIQYSNSSLSNEGWSCGCS